MDTWVWVVLVVVVLAAVAVALWLKARKQQSERLQGRFGSEYERTVEESGGRRQAEAELAERERRRLQLDIRPLDPASRERHITAWTDTQARYVDDPRQALSEADRLVQTVMSERGYPVEDFEQRAADISVDHPELVQNYRAAHAISLANERGDATTESMRQGMVHYRSLFEELLEADQTGTSSNQIR